VRPTQKTVEAFARNACGTVEVYIVRGHHLLGGMLAEDATSEAFLKAIVLWFKEVSRIKKNGPLCLHCDTEFRPGKDAPLGFSIVTPFGRDWRTSGAIMVTGICVRCMNLSDDALANRTIAMMGAQEITAGKA
jgi:hypothetical protein